MLHVMQVAGAEVLVRETIRRLAGRITPTVFCLDAVGQIGEEMKRDGIDVVCLDRRPGRDTRVSWRMARAARERGIQVMHAHQYTPFFYAALAKPLSRFGFKLVVTEHGRHYPDRVSPVRRMVNRLVLDKLADAVTACSRFSAEGLSRTDGFAGGRIEIIDNGIEVDQYGPPPDKAAARRAVGLPDDRRYVIHVARHHPVKDQATLLRGFALFAPDQPAADLLMVGDGPLRRDLEALAAKLGIADRVRFLGIRPDVPELMKAADVFALSSRSEAASLTLLEAMATGLPVVATNVGGNMELARPDREGLLYPRADPAGFADALRRVFADPDLAARLGAAGRVRTRDRYQLGRTIEDYYALYRRLCPRPA